MMPVLFPLITDQSYHSIPLVFRVQTQHSAYTPLYFTEIDYPILKYVQEYESTLHKPITVCRTLGPFCCFLRSSAETDLCWELIYYKGNIAAICHKHLDLDRNILQQCSLTQRHLRVHAQQILSRPKTLSFKHMPFPIFQNNNGCLHFKLLYRLQHVFL